MGDQAPYGGTGAVSAAVGGGAGGVLCELDADATDVVGCWAGVWHGQRGGGGKGKGKGRDGPWRGCRGRRGGGWGCGVARGESQPFIFYIPLFPEGVFWTAAASCYAEAD